MNTADAALQTLRADVINIVLGTVFLTIGATACAIAAIRGRSVNCCSIAISLAIQDGVGFEDRA